MAALTATGTLAVTGEDCLPPPGTVLRRPYKGRTALAEGLRLLGEAKAAEPLIEIGMTRGEEAWAKFSSFGILAFAGGLRRQGEAGGALRAALADHLARDRLGDFGAVRRMGFRHWRMLAYDLHKDLTPEQRQDWAARLADAVASDPQAMAAAGLGNIEHLHQAIRTLDEVEAQVFAATWIPSNEAELAAAHEKKPLPVGLCERIARARMRIRDYPKARAWAMRTYESVLGSAAAPKTPSIHDLGRLAHLMNDTGLSRRGIAFPEYATALAQVAQRGGLYTSADGRLSDTGWQRRKIGYMLVTPETRDVLGAELIDGSGMPRLEVAQILGRAYRITRELRRWQEYVNGVLSASEPMNADQMAGWLLVKADTEALAGGLDPRRADELVRQAVTVAESPQTKEKGLRLVLALHREMRGGRDVAQALESLRGAFGAGAEIQATISALQEALNAQIDVEIARDLAWRRRILLRYYQRALTEARADSDERAARHYEAKIQELQDALSRSGP